MVNTDLIAYLNLLFLFLPLVVIPFGDPIFTLFSHFFPSESPSLGLSPVTIHHSPVSLSVFTLFGISPSAFSQQTFLSLFFFGPGSREREIERREERERQTTDKDG